MSSSVDEKLLRDMTLTRRVVEVGHALREEASIKLRQPLEQLVITGAVFVPEFSAVLQEELNVRTVITAKQLPSGVDWKTKTAGPISLALDTTISDDLLQEGWVREVV